MTHETAATYISVTLLKFFEDDLRSAFDKFHQPQGDLAQGDLSYRLTWAGYINSLGWMPSLVVRTKAQAYSKLE